MWIGQIAAVRLSTRSDAMRRSINPSRCFLTVMLGTARNPKHHSDIARARQT